MRKEGSEGKKRSRKERKEERERIKKEGLVPGILNLSLFPPTLVSSLFSFLSLTPQGDNGDD